MPTWEPIENKLKQKGIKNSVVNAVKDVYQKSSIDGFFKKTPEKIKEIVTDAGDEVEKAFEIVRKELEDFLKKEKAFSADSRWLTISLVDDKDDLKLPYYRATVELLDDIGKSQTTLFNGRSNSKGEIIFRWEIPTDQSRQKLTSPPKIRLTVLDLDGDKLLVKTIKLEPETSIPPVKVPIGQQQEKLKGPLTKWCQDLNVTLSEPVAKLLKNRGIEALADIRGAKDLADDPDLSPADKSMIEQLYAHAQLQLICRDHETNQILLKKEYQSLFDIAQKTRRAFLRSLKDLLPEDRINNLYSEALCKWDALVNKSTYLRTLKANGHQVKEKISSKNLMEEPPCHCDCQSAVSPLAYLTDLLDFTVRHVLYKESSLEPVDLEKLFFQPFGSLPDNCAASESKVRQVRLCIEVLLAKAEADGINVTDTVKDYLPKAYNALLNGIGTSRRKLRLLRGATDEEWKQKAAALMIPADHLFKRDQNTGHIHSDLLFQEADLSEAMLEQIFGLQDTGRDPLSFGVKIKDDHNQVRHWQLVGVEWHRNTDAKGRIHVSVKERSGVTKIALYKEAARRTGDLIAEGVSGEYDAPNEFTLEGRNTSGLTGRLILVDTPQEDSSITIAAIPELLVWQLTSLRDFWRAEDWPEGVYDGEDLPIIDPDQLQPGDFFILKNPLPNRQNLFDLYKTRGNWITDQCQDFPDPPDPSATLTERQQRLNEMFDHVSEDKDYEAFIGHPSNRDEVIVKKPWNEDANDTWNPRDRNQTWDAIVSDLQSDSVTDETISQRMDELKTHFLTADEFSFLMVVRNRVNNNEQIEAEEWTKLCDILSLVIKRSFFPEWRKEERDLGITLSPPFFCLSSEEPQLNPVRGSASQRSIWKAELERNSGPPIIDPDWIPVSYIFTYPDASHAIDLREARATRLSLISNTFFGSRPQLTDSASAVAWLKGLLTSEDLKDESNGTILLHALGLSDEKLREARERLSHKKPLRLELERYGLKIGELKALLAVHKLVEIGAADEKDWHCVLHILTQVEKRRYLYPLWRSEELGDTNSNPPVPPITLSPDYFRIPESPLYQGMLSDSSDILTAGFIEWRFDRAALKSWKTRLNGRKDQQAGMIQSNRWIIDHAEEATLVAFRDALVDIVIKKPRGDAELIEKKKWLTNQLLINGFESTCRKTTRVAQAIETLQLLIWCIRTGQLEDPEYTINLEYYPMPGDSDDRGPFLDKMWKWMGSYGYWRAAMFAFMYPECLLQPHLRPDSEKTDLFKAFEKVLAGWIPPEQAENGDENENNDRQRNLSELNVDRLARKAYGYLEEDKISASSKEGMMKLWNKLIELRIYSRDVRVLEMDPKKRLLYNNERAKIEDIYYLPICFALSLQQKGYFSTALDWYRQVYDYDGDGLSNELREYLHQQENLDEFVREENWLVDPLNPHAIAATRTDVDLRFILLSIISCLLDYAESEFAIDNAESIGRARELYHTAQRLLDLPALKQGLKECQEMIGELVLRIGKDKWKEREILVSVSEDWLGPAARSDRIPVDDDNLTREVKAALKEPKTSEAIEKLRQVASKHFPRHRENNIQIRRKASIGKQKEICTKLLENQSIFKSLQILGTPLENFGDTPPATTYRVAPASMVSHRTPQGDVLDKPFMHRVYTAPRYGFCIPPNWILSFLREKAENGLFNLNNCRNLDGLQREVPTYAAPTDTHSGMPEIGISGAITLPDTVSLKPTQYRYKALIERAKELVQLAQRMEERYLSFLENLDRENYELKRAEADLDIASATKDLQDLRKTAAQNEKNLAKYRVDRVEELYDYYDELLSEPRLAREQHADQMLYWAGIFSAASGQHAASLSTIASRNAMIASFERREQEWEFQRDLNKPPVDEDFESAGIDWLIANQQLIIAGDQQAIVDKEYDISILRHTHAQDVVNFLNNQFTSAELYEWMSGIVGEIYRKFLELATATAKLAQMQLSYERQEASINLIMNDYWLPPNEGLLLGSGSNEQEQRRGMTGSARLLQDMYLMDQHAFTTDQRKLQLKKTISLAMLDPVAFHRFLQTGDLPFNTTLEMFDHDFPGHYMRLIKRVKISVVCLASTIEGINATLYSDGTSRVVLGEKHAFDEINITRTPESVSLTSPVDATGVFDLQEQPEMLLPFEGSGVASNWMFRMPKAANSVDFRTIADILITIEYTAFSSALYRQQVIKQMDRNVSGELPYSFRHNFPDAWYDLHNPEQDATPMTVTFKTRREDFPPNINALKITEVTLYFIQKQIGEENRALEPVENINVNLNFIEQSGAKVQSDFYFNPDADGVVSTRRGNATFWVK